MSFARDLWLRIETLHAVTYFAPESRDAASAAGLRGFWMGYFGFRAAPLGVVSAEAVTSAFFNFAPRMVARSLPDAWDFAAPADLVAARAAAAALALRRLVPDIDAVAAVAVAPLTAASAVADGSTGPMFAANRDVAPFDDPVAELWQRCTTLREHRGDGHVGALIEAGVDGCEAHRLLVAERGIPAEVLVDNRGWTAKEWGAAGERLRGRGLVDGDGRITERGRACRSSVEEQTDQRAELPLVAALTDEERVALLGRLTPAATQVSASGALPYPNPMGLPSLA